MLAWLAPQVATGVKASLLVDHSAVSSALLRLLRAARSYVCLCIPDLADAHVIAALEAAAARGVEVRVVVGTTRPPLLAGCEVVGFSQHDFLSMWVPQWRQKLGRYVPADLLQLYDLGHGAVQNARAFPVCMRRSFVVVDGAHSLVGSFHARPQWHNAAVGLEGAGAGALLHRAFVSLWFMLGGSPYEWSGERYTSQVSPAADWTDEVAVCMSFPGNPFNVLHKHALEAVAFSSSPVFMETPHFVDPTFMQQLRAAGPERSGQVHVVTSALHNPNTLIAALLHAQASVAGFDNLFDLRDRFTHASLLVSGAAVMAGSHAHTARPDLDIGVLVRSAELASLVANQIHADMQASDRVVLAPTPATVATTLRDTFV